MVKRKTAKSESFRFELSSVVQNFPSFSTFKSKIAQLFFARRPNSDKIQTLSLFIYCSPIEDFSPTGLALWLLNIEDHKDR